MYSDNLCLFHCLALHTGCTLQNLESKAKELFLSFCNYAQVDFENFQAVTLRDLVQIENFFHFNINVYALNWEESAVAKILQRSRHLFSSTINLNLYKNHFSFIHNMQLYTGRYVCPRYSKIWTENNNYHHHIRTCEFQVKHKYVGGVYHTPQTIFEKLD